VVAELVQETLKSRQARGRDRGRDWAQSL